MSNISQIVFADLTHTGITVDANFFPLGCGLIAAYAMQELGDKISVNIFKYPEDFSSHLDKYKPRIAAFSNYSWCFNLNYAFAQHIKKKYPDVIVVFGGPNYPIETDKQINLLSKYSAIDFYIEGEGEIAFVELYKVLAEHSFSVTSVKNKGQKIPNTHYLADSVFFSGAALPRINDINIIPSPYLIGLMDKFFDMNLTPLLQTSRGCPYTCAYCHDGISYMNKLNRFSQQRINDEIIYCLERRQVSNITLTDQNFGIYEEDIDTASLIAALRDQYGWPYFLDTTVAKQNKDRVIKIANMLKGGLFFLGVSVQSTDSHVLDNINRRNVSIEQMVELLQFSKFGAYSSFSEVILCLPGDTKDKHIRSVFDMMDIGVEEIRQYQFILLPGTLVDSDEYRKKYEYKTLYRVLPRCFGNYSLYGETFNVFEYHEVCVGNNTMSYEDYLYCRNFNLTVEIFNNGGILRELFLLLKRYNISRSNLLAKVVNKLADYTELEGLYKKFREDEHRNFWISKEELEDFLSTSEAIELYKTGELGVNQIFRYRSMALFEYLHIIADIAFAVARNLLKEIEKLSEDIDAYLTELQLYILLKKGNLFDLTDQPARRFNFDFVRLTDEGFYSDPSTVIVCNGVLISFIYSEEQRHNIDLYYNQFGRSLKGLAYYLQRGGPLSSLYRNVVYA